VPEFNGGRGDVHDRVRQEMRAVLVGKDIASYLDATARELLGEARKQFSHYGLEYRNIGPERL
jgi:ATP-dependent Lhr-like helicase